MWRALAVVALLAVSACSNIKDTAEPPAPLPVIQNTLSLPKIWQRNLGGDAGLAALQLAADDGHVYVANGQGKVRALALKDGKPVWQQNLKTDLSAALVADEAYLYLTTHAGAVLALDKTSGKTVWQRALDGQVLAEPAYNAHVLVLQANNGVIYGLDKLSGKQLWQVKRQPPTLSLRGNSAPLVSGNQVFVGMDNGRLLVLGANDGKVLLESAIGVAHGKTEIDRLTDIDAPLLLADGVLYLSAYHNGTHALDIGSGRTLWQRAQIFTSHGASLDADALVMLDSHAQLWRLDAKTGKTLWLQNNLRARQLNFPTLYQQYILVGDFEGYVHVFSAKDGTLLASQRFGDAAFVSRFVVAGDTLLLLNQDAELVAIKIAAAKS